PAGTANAALRPGCPRLTDGRRLPWQRASPMQETGQRRAAERVLAPWSLSSGILPCSRCASEGARELVSGTGSGCPPGTGILTLRARLWGCRVGYSRHGRNRAKSLKVNEEMAGEPGFEPGLTESESYSYPRNLKGLRPVILQKWCVESIEFFVTAVK